jgi:GNAT superfamily N-acetyltransferase
MTITIRPAQLSDSELILRFIRELAEYEKAADAVEATTASIEQSLFGSQSVTHAVICEIDGEPVGFAVWFYTYSTWLARNGLYLEDLYVTPEKRGSGAGKALLKYLAKLAVEKGCGRFEWSVLDWNEPAIRVYRAIGAEPQDEWVRYRLAGDTLKAFADS